MFYLLSKVSDFVGEISSFVKLKTVNIRYCTTILKLNHRHLRKEETFKISNTYEVCVLYTELYGIHHTKSFTIRFWF